MPTRTTLSAPLVAPLVVAATLFVGTAISPCAGAVSALTSVTIAVTPKVAGIDSPEGITAGPDGAIWFTNTAGNSIGRITTAGVVTIYTGSKIDAPWGIATGSDGDLWFTNSGSNSIGRITTSGIVMNIFVHKGISDPTGITAGPDDSLWFTNSGSNSIGRITTSGAVSIFHQKKPNQIDDPVAITTGPDGALWFTNYNNNSIGRITTSDKIKHYSSPPGVMGQISEPNAITSGPDTLEAGKALWFTNYYNDTIEEISIEGHRTDFHGYPKIAYPEGITEGPDGNLWFTNVGFVGRLIPNGKGEITDFTSKIGRTAQLQGIALGPDGNLWFTISNLNQIGSISTSGTVSIYG